MTQRDSALSPESGRCETANAREADFLIDGRAYFRVLRLALLRARRRVLIVGWDLHGSTVLPGDDGLRDQLAPLLCELVRRRPELEVWVLVWRAPLLYRFDRDTALQRRLRVPSGRLHFAWDEAHPPGGSQHQKVVVVDDEIGFCGGLDVTGARWDTREHRPRDARRTTPDGESYLPFHDLQMVVTGEAAAALARVAGRRWERATGETLPPQADAEPIDTAGILGDAPVRDAPVCIARTLPEHRSQAAVREIEGSLLAAIAAARLTIYIENQYFCADAVIDALSMRLGEDDGPEVVVVTTRENPSSIEALTMDVLRDHAVLQLRQADRHGRFQIYAPLHDRRDIKVHAKVAIFDDRIAQVGSANISNRSMGLDSECNLILDAPTGRDDLRAAIARLRDTLLAEHLGVAREVLEEALAREGSFIAAIEALRGGRRELVALPEPKRPLPPREELGIADTAQPYERELKRTVGPAARAESRRALLSLGGVVGLLLASALAFHLLDPTAARLASDAERWLGGLRHSAWTLPLATLAFAVGATLSVPVLLLILAAGLLLDPVDAFLTALTGAVVSAAAHYGLGSLLGRERLRGALSRRLPAVGRALRRRGAVAVAALRLVPVAPFSVVNLLAGALRVGLPRFLLGTCLGLLPGVILLSLLGARIVEAAAHPSPTSVGLAVLLGGATLALIHTLERAVQRMDEGGNRSPS
ncbi:MAG: VTT domain-containing protein [Myxococcales bacterium]|jgi:phosphatidylserine/phosphatidylglycerophosphate/cardiolipin synthase-like enzyme/uncharacterized membrane protein YdjX (TVP38/TMEM64 family)